MDVSLCPDLSFASMAIICSALKRLLFMTSCWSSSIHNFLLLLKYTRGVKSPLKNLEYSQFGKATVFAHDSAYEIAFVSRKSWLPSLAGKHSIDIFSEPKEIISSNQDRFLRFFFEWISYGWIHGEYIWFRGYLLIDRIAQDPDLYSHASANFHIVNSIQTVQYDSWA